MRFHDERHPRQCQATRPLHVYIYILEAPEYGEPASHFQSNLRPVFFVKDFEQNEVVVMVKENEHSPTCVEIDSNAPPKILFFFWFLTVSSTIVDHAQQSLKQ